jgi:hypothetical protein
MLAWATWDERRDQQLDLILGHTARQWLKQRYPALKRRRGRLAIDGRGYGGKEDHTAQPGQYDDGKADAGAQPWAVVTR